MRSDDFGKSQDSNMADPVSYCLNGEFLQADMDPTSSVGVKSIRRYPSSCASASAGGTSSVVYGCDFVSDTSPMDLLEVAYEVPNPPSQDVSYLILTSYDNPVCGGNPSGGVGYPIGMCFRTSGIGNDSLVDSYKLEYISGKLLNNVLSSHLFAIFIISIIFHPI